MARKTKTEKDPLEHYRTLENGDHISTEINDGDDYFEVAIIKVNIPFNDYVDEGSECDHTEFQLAIRTPDCTGEGEFPFNLRSLNLSRGNLVRLKELLNNMDFDSEDSPVRYNPNYAVD